MSTTPTQIRIDTAVKEQATILFAELGMDMSSAVNIFLRQCILRGGLPFSVELPNYSQQTLNAIVEARQISRMSYNIQYISLFLLYTILIKNDTFYFRYI